MKITSIQVGPIMTNCYLLCDEDAKVCALIDPCLLYTSPSPRDS